MKVKSWKRILHKSGKLKKAEAAVVISGKYRVRIIDYNKR